MELNGPLIYYFFKPHEIKSVRRKKVEEFGPNTVVPWIEDCVRNGGIPEFRVRYKDDYGFFYEGKPAAYAMCMGDRGNRVPTVLFTDVPQDLWLSMAGSKGDWEKILKYYGVPIPRFVSISARYRRNQLLR